jgi:hypothetical protein
MEKRRERGIEKRMVKAKLRAIERKGKVERDRVSWGEIEEETGGYRKAERDKNAVEQEAQRKISVGRERVPTQALLSRLNVSYLPLLGKGLEEVLFSKGTCADSGTFHDCAAGRHLYF